MNAYQHQPVLLDEAVSSLNIQPDGVYLDGTFGRGGHSRAIIARLTEQGRLLALDKDPEAIAAGLEEFGDDPRFSLLQSSFADMDQVVRGWGVSGALDGILLDIRPSCGYHSE